MGGGATHIDIPIQFKTSSPIFPSPSPTSHPPSSLNFPVSINRISDLTQYRTSDCLGEKQNRSDNTNSIFGTVPSQFEVETALSALQKFLQGILSSESQFTGGYGRFDMPFLSLLREPIIMRLVISVSSDEAVWDALMNNQMVRQLLEAHAPRAHTHLIKSCNEEQDVIACIISWLVDKAKAKVTELIQKFELLMNQIFQQHERNKEEEEMDDIVRSSFILSLVILLIVVVARFHNA